MTLKEKEIANMLHTYEFVHQFRKDLVAHIDRNGLWGCEPVTALYDSINRSCSRLWSEATKPVKE